MFREMKPQEIKDNPFELIGKEWLLVAANKDGKSNAMTASWGAVVTEIRQPDKGGRQGIGNLDRDPPAALHEDFSGSDRDVFPWYFPGNTAGDVKLHGNSVRKDRG